MSIHTAFKTATRHLTLKNLRNTFFGVVMYSETINPYQKLGLGVVCVLQPINIPGPIDGLFYLGLLVDGSRGIYKDLKERITGETRRRKDEFKMQCLHASFERVDSRHMILKELPRLPACHVTSCNSL